MELKLSSLYILFFLLSFGRSYKFYTHSASTFTPSYILRVTYQLGSAACREKPLALVNGTSPGPRINIPEGQTTWIRVYNDMQGQNLTMHWHGLSQRVAPFSDGTPQASQWPISPGHFFDYELHPEVGEAGTYFYHSHVDVQAVSAAGALIVTNSTATPYTYDDERVMVLTEWYNQTSSEITEEVSNPKFGYSGEPEAVLINGKSYTALDSPAGGDPASNYSVINNSLTCGPEVFQVYPGKTYRFRAIGGTAMALIALQYEAHNNLTVIAADGTFTKPANTNRIQVSPGQRFDWLLTTKSQAEITALNQTNFWMQFETRYRTVNVTSYAILQYITPKPATPIPKSPPNPMPLNISDTSYDWLEYTLQPLQPNGFPPASRVNRTVTLISAEYQSGTSNFWTVNHNTWTEFDERLNHTAYNNLNHSTGTPYLVDIYNRGQAAIPNYQLAVSQYGGWDPNLNVYAAKVGEIIDVVLINQPNGAIGIFDLHPWHIHGNHVWDLGSGPGTYNATANEQKLKGFNPALRDTLNLYKYVDNEGTTLPAYSNQGWRAFRLNVTNAGVWMVHCHILQHMTMGMQTVWVMGDAKDIVPKAEPYVTGYLNYGGSAYGNSTYDPIVGHYFDD